MVEATRFSPFFRSHICCEVLDFFCEFRRGLYYAKKFAKVVSTMVETRQRGRVVMALGRLVNVDCHGLQINDIVVSGKP